MLILHSLLATIGIYQDAIMQKSVDGVDTEAHIFEFTSSLSMNPKLQVVHPQPGDSKSLVPVQFIFVLKVRRMISICDRLNAGSGQKREEDREWQ
jgi:hypothetical protein